MPPQLRMEDKNILEHYSDLSVGDVLARARKGFGLSLQQAAQQTLIRTDIIEALELEDKDKLPTRVYTLGFVKNYAEFLGLDAEKMIYLYKLQVIGLDENDNKKADKKALGKPEFNSVMASSLPTYILLGSGAALVISAVLFFIYTVLSHFGNEENTKNITKEFAGHDVAALSAIMNEEENLQNAMLSDVDLAKWKAMDAPKASQQADFVLPSAGGKAYGVQYYADGLVLKATRTVWVKISSSEGELLLNTILKQGDVVYIAPHDVLSLETMYAEALDVYVDNQFQGYLKGKENEQREIILSKENVKEHIAPHSDKKQKK